MATGWLQRAIREFWTYCVDGFLFDEIEFFWAQLIKTHVLIIFITQIITILKKVLPLLTLNSLIFSIK